MNFLNFLNFFKRKQRIPDILLQNENIQLYVESFDSSYKIKRHFTNPITKSESFDININGKFYQVTFDEEPGSVIHIVFKRLDNGEWKIFDMTRDMGHKEMLGLFGTIKKQLLKKKFNAIAVYSNENKKLQFYIKLFEKFISDIKPDFKVLHIENEGVLIAGNVHFFDMLDSGEESRKNILNQIKIKLNRFQKYG